jgi:hypothetical protein
MPRVNTERTTQTITTLKYTKQELLDWLGIPVEAGESVYLSTIDSAQGTDMEMLGGLSIMIVRSETS